MIRLRLGTASQEVPLGPFVDATDGSTLEDGLGPIAASDIKLWKSGASSMVNASGTAAFMVDGTYVVTLDATDTNTIGPLVIVVSPAGARPIRVECEVLPGAVFDVMFGDGEPVARLSAFGLTIATGVVGAGATTTAIPVGVDFSTTDAFNQANQQRGRWVVVTFNSTNNVNTKGQGCRIVSHPAKSGSFPTTTTTLTVEPALATAPAAGDIFVIFDAAIGTPQVVDLTTKLPAALVGGRIDASIGALGGSTQAADNLRKQGLAAAAATLGAGSTTTVLQLSSITPTLTTTNQLKGRVVLVVDDSGSEAALKLQGGRIAASTTTALTLEQPLTAAPAAGNVLIVV